MLQPTQVLNTNRLYILYNNQSELMQFGGHTMISDNYYIKHISKKDANRIQEPNHYLHRNVSVTYAFGIVEKISNDIKGVVMYGMPPSPPLCKGVCGEDERKNVIELNRLWISDEVGKNAETWLIANSMKCVNHEIIVSYADPSAGHLGTIYQAGNWIYTGLSSPHKDFSIKGKKLHPKAIANKLSLAELKEMPDFEYVQRVRKHRYVFFNCDKRRKKELYKKLKYPIFPYPKNNVPIHGDDLKCQSMN
jgi:hypothetical protein